MDHADLANRFQYHKPDAEAAQRHETVRRNVLELARGLNEVLPEGREKSLAMTHLEEVMFWANAAIARQQPLGDLNDHPAMKEGGS